MCWACEEWGEVYGFHPSLSLVANAAAAAVDDGGGGGCGDQRAKRSLDAVQDLTAKRPRKSYYEGTMTKVHIVEDAFSTHTHTPHTRKCGGVLMPRATCVIAMVAKTRTSLCVISAMLRGT